MRGRRSNDLDADLAPWHESLVTATAACAAAVSRLSILTLAEVMANSLSSLLSDEGTCLRSLHACQTAEQALLHGVASPVLSKSAC